MRGVNELRAKNAKNLERSVPTRLGDGYELPPAVYQADPPIPSCGAGFHRNAPAEPDVPGGGVIHNAALEVAQGVRRLDQRQRCRVTCR